MNDDLKTIIIISLAISTVVIFYFIYSRRNKEGIKKTKDDIPYTDAKKDVIKNKIQNYFNEYENDIKNYELHNYYNRQFDLTDITSNYERKVEMIGNLNDLELFKAEYEIGNKILIKMAEDTIGVENSSLKWGDALIYLHEYKRLTANIKALDQIRGEVKNHDKHSKYLDQIKQKLQDLKKKYSSKI